MAAPARACGRLEVTNALGLHARPAARIATVLREFRADVRFALRTRHANARSVLEILGLLAHRGDVLDVTAVGDDAEACLRRLEQTFSGLGALDG